MCRLSFQRRRGMQDLSTAPSGAQMRQHVHLTVINKMVSTCRAPRLECTSALRKRAVNTISLPVQKSCHTHSPVHIGLRKAFMS
nr:hypothetical protein CFP56_24344 [Quercus suber]